jgi:hypothetical protein
MPVYTLKLYRRQEPHASPGKLVGSFSFTAPDHAAAVTSAMIEYAAALADCDYAFIGGPHGRRVWEKPVG